MAITLHSPVQPFRSILDVAVCRYQSTLSSSETVYVKCADGLWEERLDISSFSAKEFHLAWAWLYSVYALRVDAYRHVAIHYKCVHLCRRDAEECVCFIRLSLYVLKLWHHIDKYFVSALPPRTTWSSHMSAFCLNFEICEIICLLSEKLPNPKNILCSTTNQCIYYNMVCNSPTWRYHIFSSTLFCLFIQFLTFELCICLAKPNSKL